MPRFCPRKPHGELRVIGDNGPDTHNHGVHQGPQAVQMHNCRFTVDVVRVARGCGDAPIEGLAELTDHEILILRDLGQSGVKRPQTVAM